MVANLWGELTCLCTLGELWNRDFGANTVQHEQRQPSYICPDGRPEVPPHHVDLVPQQVASPWRTEYQDAFAWVDLMVRAQFGSII